MGLYDLSSFLRLERELWIILPPFSGGQEGVNCDTAIEGTQDREVPPHQYFWPQPGLDKPPMHLTVPSSSQHAEAWVPTWVDLSLSCLLPWL